MNRSVPTGVVAKRHPVSFLGDIVYAAQPMPIELAETIRTLRRHHGLSYEDIMWALAQSDPDPSQCFGFGKALTELASRVLNDDDPAWT